jgi:hypothetical protein
MLYNGTIRAVADSYEGNCHLLNKSVRRVFGPADCED